MGNTKDTRNVPLPPWTVACFPGCQLGTVQRVDVSTERQCLLCFSDGNSIRNISHVPDICADFHKCGM